MGGEAHLHSSRGSVMVALSFDESSIAVSTRSGVLSAWPGRGAGVCWRRR